QPFYLLRLAASPSSSPPAPPVQGPQPTAALTLCPGPVTARSPRGHPCHQGTGGSGGAPSRGNVSMMVSSVSSRVCGRQRDWRGAASLKGAIMDFELSDEQRLLRDTLRAFVDEQIRPVAREWEAAERYPDELVATMRQMGLFGLMVPEEYGGMAADMVSLALVFEEISRGWMGVAGILGSHSLSCWMIAQYGTPEQKRAHLPALATGERRTGIALTEPAAGSDLQGIQTVARRDGDVYMVSGRKTWITNARHADPLPVLVKTDPAARPAHAGMSVLLVDAGTAGFQVVRDLPKLGYHGPETCELVLDDVRVPAGNLLGGTEGRGGSTSRPARLESRRRPMTRRCAMRGSARRSGRRSPASRLCSSSWPTWR